VSLAGLTLVSQSKRFVLPIGELRFEFVVGFSEPSFEPPFELWSGSVTGCSHWQARYYLEE
jgi:hypothetical protein